MNRRHTSLIWAFGVLVMACPLTSFATGYYIGEHDAVANGRGLAVTARLEEPSVLFYNPAGLSYLQGFNLSIGGTIIIPRFSYSDPEGRKPSTDAKKDNIFAPHVYFTYTTKNQKWGFGLGFNSPFGLAVKWPVGFALEDRTAAIDLKMPTLHLAASFKPIEQLSIGVSLRVVPASVELLQRFKLVNDQGDMVYGYGDLGASAVGVGGAFGIMARPIKNLHLGFSYISRIKFNFDGDGSYYPGDGVSDTRTFHDQKGSTSLTSPDIFSFGIGYEPIKNLYFEFDFNYTLWSVYKDLQIDFSNDPTGVLTQKGKQKKDWKDTPTYRLACEYKPITQVALRLAGGYDVTPTPDSTLGPELPDSNRIFLAFGAGYKDKKTGLKIDAAYTLVLFRDRTVTASDGNPSPATYKGTAHLVGITAGVQF